MTGGSQARKARTRERILSAAVDLFLENGFHGTNIDSVASRSHSSKQTIYKYYDDKEEILEHVINRLREEVSEEALKVDLQSDDYENELRAFGQRYLAAILRERQVQTFRLCVEMARKTNGLATPFGRIDSDEIQSHLGDYINQLHARNILPRGDDAEFMAQAFLGMIRGNFHLYKALDESYTPSRKELAAHVDQVTRMFCAALTRKG